MSELMPVSVSQSFLLQSLESQFSVSAVSGNFAKERPSPS